MSTSIEESDEKNTEEKKIEEYESLKSSKFKQQKLPAWRPVPTITSSTVTFFLFGIIFIIIGVFISSLSKQIVEVKQRYDNLKTYYNASIKVSFTLDKTIKNPMIYYQIDGFYQNHRRYVKSKDDEQLSGKDLTLSQIKKNGNCKPVETNKEMGAIYNVNKSKLDPDDVAIPCGLLARSYFRDYFTLFKKDGEKIDINETNIIYGADRKKFNNTGNISKQWIDMTDEHFIVWMRPSGLPNFRKLWGRIDNELEKGDYYFMINDVFDVKKFKGKKYVIISNANMLGGKNDGLAICFIIVGVLSIVIGITFLIWYFIKKSKEEKEKDD